MLLFSFATTLALSFNRWLFRETVGAIFWIKAECVGDILFDRFLLFMFLEWAVVILSLRLLSAERMLDDY
jgi:hypothetical protein